MDKLLLILFIILTIVIILYIKNNPDIGKTILGSGFWSSRSSSTLPRDIDNIKNKITDYYTLRDLMTQYHTLLLQKYSNIIDKNNINYLQNIIKTLTFNIGHHINIINNSIIYHASDIKGMKIIQNDFNDVLSIIKKLIYNYFIVLQGIQYNNTQFSGPVETANIIIYSISPYDNDISSINKNIYQGLSYM